MLDWLMGLGEVGPSLSLASIRQRLANSKKIDLFWASMHFSAI
jgi:hypothetical protein